MMHSRCGRGLALFALSCTMSCGRPVRDDSSLAGAISPKPTYDPASGKLTRLEHDTNMDGRLDSWVWMDTGRVVRAEADTDGNGNVDRWEYYDTEARLLKVGFSRAGSGREDAWAYPAADGSLARLDIAGGEHGGVTRIEHYGQGRLLSAESDEDADGRPEKWEQYQDGRLASVAIDTRHGGVADRRLIYAEDGSVTVIDAAPSGASGDSRSLSAGR